MACNDCDAMKLKLRHAQFKLEEAQRDLARKDEEIHTLRHTVGVAINILSSMDEERALERERMDRNVYR